MLQPLTFLICLSIQPMPIIFRVTIAVIVIGIVIAVYSAGFMRIKEKQS